MPQLSQIIGPFEFEIPGYGKVQLKTAGTAARKHAFGLAPHESEEEAAAAFSNALISAMLVDPLRTDEELASLDEASMAFLCEAAAQANHYKDEWNKTPSDLAPRTRLYKAHLFHEQAQQEALKARAAQLTPFLGWRDSSRLVKSISALGNTPLSNDTLNSMKQLVSAYTNLWASTTPPSVVRSALESINLLQSSSLREPMLAALEQNRRFQEAILATSNQPLLDAAKAALQFIPPEPFFSDTLINLHLNTPEIHVPSHMPFQPSPEPIDTVEEWEERVEDAELKRIQDAQSIISKLEWEIRKLIEARLRELYGDEWWEKGVQPTVRTKIEAEKRKKQKQQDDDRHPIYYAHFDDYRAIIKKKENWSTVFCKIFVKDYEFDTMFDWLCELRPPVQHTRPISQEHFMQLTIASHWYHTSVFGKNWQARSH